MGIMSTVQTKLSYGSKKNICVGDRTIPLSISSNLFRDLRKFDQEGIEIILAESVDDYGLGKAIMNRLSKASGKIIIV